MSNAEIISLILFLIAVLSGFIMLGLLFYIGKTRIREIDKAVLGYEMPNDSIFALIVRVPNYAGGFLWKWSARRTGLEGKIEHFDSRFQWPFKAVMILALIVGGAMLMMFVLDKIFGIN